MTHVIQREILSKLISNSHLRYSKLKPKNLESNHFVYHLNILMREGLIVKNEEGQYLLSSRGKQYADNLSLDTFKPRKQPNIVTLITCQNEKGQWLVFTRKRQPLLGQTGFVYGKLHIGETISEAAHRELMEKTGLQCELTHKGDGYVTIYEKGEPVSQIFFHMFYGKNPFGEIKKNHKNGTTMWAWEEEFKHPPFMASMQDLAKLVKESRSERFFVELIYQYN